MGVWSVVAAIALVGCGGGSGGDVSGDVNVADVEVPYKIGGAVTGLQGSGLVLAESGRALAIGADGPFSFSGGLTSGVPYSVIVATQPSGQYCHVINGEGVLGAARTISHIVVTCAAVAARYSNGLNWNDWVKNDGPTVFEASGASCDPRAVARTDSCAHGGELRMWETGRAIACAGLEIRDALDAFDWVCTQTPAGTARIVSSGLKQGRKLSDLIDAAALDWRPNRIEVTGAANFDSGFSRWWANPVIVSNASRLLDFGTIHLVTEDVAASFWMVAGSALVVMPGKTVRQIPGGELPVVAQGGLGGVWLEGNFDGGAVKFDSIPIAVVRGVRVSNSAATGVWLLRTPAVLIDVHAHNNFGDGVLADRSVRLSGVTTAHNGTGVRASGPWTRITGLTSAHNRTDGVIVVSDDAVLTNVTATSNGGNGIVLGNAAGAGARAIGMQLVAVNNNASGIAIGGVGHTLVDIAAGSNRLEGLRFETLGHRLSGTFRLSALSDCGGLMAGVCVNVAPSDALFAIGGGLNTAFVGGIATDDPLNMSDTNGGAAYAAIGDWVRFANEFRGWGPDGGAAPDATNRGRCNTSATCRIWDWSLNAAATPLRNVFSPPAGNDSIGHRWTAANSTDCASNAGASWDAASGACTSRFLRRASETSGPGRGNQNGICESNETCLFTPNYGAYQGHGTLGTAGPFVDGQIQGVSLQRFTVNGR